VWKLTSSGALTVLHHFVGGTGGGDYPLAGLARDSKGNLYGVTYYGGLYGQGTVFKVKSKAFTLLHSFQLSFGRLLSSWSIDRRQEWKSLWDWECRRCLRCRNGVEADSVVSASKPSNAIHCVPVPSREGAKYYQHEKTLIWLFSVFRRRLKEK
jgi:uncharacterized repeat protein (TIGR03803 family)